MEYKLTQFTEAGGCGCKIAPDVLTNILNYRKSIFIDNNVIVGNSNNDDAAIYKISDSTAIVSTLDFFSPIVNDPYTFGQIAAANALSDVYAMGGKPIWALAILGFPVNLLEHSVGTKIIEGAISICENENVSIIGGHTINNPQPIFGLSVNGIIDIKNIKQNNNAEIGDYLFLTKPLGLGILSTALKLEKIEQTHYNLAVQNMIQLNTVGIEFAKLDYVTAMTDITGFGLLGHLLEICKSSQVSAEIQFDKVLTIDGVENYIKQNIITGGGKRNWVSYKKYIFGTNDLSRIILSDPQTNGGLLVVVKSKFVDAFKSVLKKNNFLRHIEPIGRITPNNNNQINVL